MTTIQRLRRSSMRDRLTSVLATASRSTSWCRTPPASTCGASRSRRCAAPIFFDLRSDPTERGQEGMGYNDWWYRHAFYRRSDAADRRQLPRQLQGVPAPPAAGQLHHRQGARGAEQALGQPLIGGRRREHGTFNNHWPAGVHHSRCDRSVRAGRQPVGRTSSSSSPMTSATPTSAIAAARSIRPTSTRWRTAACGWSRSTASPSAPRHGPH